MSGLSPASVLFSSDGYELAVVNGSAIPTGNRGLLVEGSDGTNSRFITVDTSGRVTMVGAGVAGTPAGGVLSVQGVSGGQAMPVSGTVTANQGSANTAANAWTTLVTDGTNTLGVTAHPFVVTGSGTAGTAATGVVTIQGIAGGTTVPVSGTVTATNASVGTDGAAVLTSDTQVGGSVTTAAPTYTTGNLNALSLTTKGGLRIDGVYPTAAAAASTDAMYVAGAVTTAAPAYTTGQMDPLSLNTAGGLRIDGVSATAAATGSTAMLSGGAVTTAAPAYTTGQMDPLSLTTAGLLRIDGVYPVNATTPTTDAVFVAGAVTTAAPSYTTGQMSALSLDTNGNLRTTAVVNKASTSTVTSVAGATSSTSVLASNASRIFAAIYNNTTKNMYVLLGAGTASPTNCTTVLMKGVYWEVPVDYTGAIAAIWDAGVSGSALMTELTP